MISALTLASLMAFAPAPAPAAGSAPTSPSELLVPCLQIRPSSDETLREMYLSGTAFPGFLEAARRRKELWVGNWAKSEGLDPDLMARARAVGGTWRLLAVAVDSCSDSVSTIPYIARLVALVDGLDLRIVDSSVGRKVMDDHPTPDGRGATPTLVLLDADWNEAGCFIERPKSLQEWVLENNGKIEQRQLVDQKMEWYAENAGAETVGQVVAMLEAAAVGRSACG